MHNSLEPLHRRLVEPGCPRKRARRLVQEVADHRDDLLQAGRQEGCSEAATSTRPSARYFVWLNSMNRRGPRGVASAHGFSASVAGMARPSAFGSLAGCPSTSSM